MLCCKTLSYVVKDYTTLQDVTLRCKTLHYVARCYTTLQEVTLRCKTLHYVALRCKTLQDVTLRCQTLHYILRYTIYYFAFVQDQSLDVMFSCIGHVYSEPATKHHVMYSKYFDTIFR